MTDSPLVSVIVTSYNHAKYIGAALDSIYAQSWKNMQVIVVDDASTDGSQKIIRRYKKRYGLTFIERETNYYSAENKQGDKPIIQAMKCAAGQYIAVVDSDDLILPGKLSRQVTLMEANPECTLCYGGVDMLLPDGQRVPYPTHFANGDLFRQLLVVGNCCLYIGSLIRRSAFERIERSSPDLVQEDWDMFLRLASLGPFVSDPRVVALYRRHDNNTWYRMDRRGLMYTNRMMILDSWQAHPEWPEAMATRWFNYINDPNPLPTEDLTLLLRQRPTDALLHCLKFRESMRQKNLTLARKHLSLAIAYCDDRLRVLVMLYEMAVKVLTHPVALDALLKDMEKRLPQAKMLPCYQAAHQSLLQQKSQA